MNNSPITIVLADDEHLIRGALAALLDLEDDFTVVAEVANGTDALDVVGHEVLVTGALMR